MASSRIYSRTARRLALLVVAFAVASPLLLTNVGAAEAACTLVWTNNITASKAAPSSGTYSYTTKVTYKLRFDTCRLGVYDKVKVVTYTNQLHMFGSIFPDFLHRDQVTVIWSNFAGFAYPGPDAYADQTDINRIGNGYLTRTRSPGTVMNYDPDIAVYEDYALQNLVADERYAFKFLTGKLYCQTVHC